MLHLLDLKGNADLSGTRDEHQITPLMHAVSNWNVRIVDYLM